MGLKKAFDQLAKTAEQKLTQKARTNKWYSGDKPTARETLAHIYTITEGDDVGRKTLYDKFVQEQNTRGSMFYNPYSKATNTKAIQGLTDLGFDLSGGINQKFLEDNAGLRNYDRTASGYSPLAPSKSSTPQQDAAYYYNKLQEAEERTANAETEWSAMQNELTYWAKAGLSDQEAIGKINWKNYPTLRKMDEGRLSGDPIILNRGIGYSEDAMYGTLWAARNNGGTGNSMADAVLSAQGKGNLYKADPVAEAKRNPASKDFNPYTRPTIDAALMRYGVDSIDDAWLEANRGMLNDPEQAEEWRDLYEINENTKAAKEEYTDMRSQLDSLIDNGMSAEAALNTVQELRYDTLAKMDEARRMGEAYPLTQAVNYRWEDVVAYANVKAEAVRIRRQATTSPEAMQTASELAKDEYIAKNGSLAEGDVAAPVSKSGAWFYSNDTANAGTGLWQSVKAVFSDAELEGKTASGIIASSGATDIASAPAKPEPLTADEEKRLAQIEEELAGYGQMKDELFANMDEVSAQNAWAPYAGLYNELFAERESLNARKSATPAAPRHREIMSEFADIEGVTPDVFAGVLGDEHVDIDSDKWSLVKFYAGDGAGLAYKNIPAIQAEYPEVNEALADMDKDELATLYRAGQRRQELKTEAIEIMHDGSLSVEDRLSLGESVGAYTECAELAFNEFRRRADASGVDDYFNADAQSVAVQIADWVVKDGVAIDQLSGKVPMTEETKAMLAKYGEFAQKAFDIKDSSYYALQFAESAMGGQLRGSQFNDGVNFWDGLMVMGGLTATKFNKFLADVGSATVMAAGAVVEGSEWVSNNTVRKWLGMAENNAASDALYGLAESIQGWNLADSSDWQNRMLTEGNTFQILGITAGSEMGKMAAMGQIGKGLNAVLKAYAPLVQTAQDVVKFERLSELFGLSPFTAESFGSQTTEAYAATGDPLKAIACGTLSALTTMATADLGSAKDVVGLSDFSAKLLQKLNAITGAGPVAALKRGGTAMAMILGNMFKKMVGEGAQEAIEDTLTEAGTAPLKGENFFDQSVEDIAAKATQSFSMGAILGLAGEISAAPSWSKTWIAVESVMQHPVPTDADIEAIMEANEADHNDPVYMAEVERAAEEIAEAAAFTAAVNEQAELVQKVSEQMATAEAGLADAQSRLSKAVEALEVAKDAVLANPTPDTAKRHSSALQEAVSARSAVQAAQTAVANAKTAGEKLFADAKAKAEATVDAVSVAQEQETLSAKAEADANAELMANSDGLVAYTSREVKNLTSGKGFAQGGEESFSDFVRKSAKRAYGMMKKFYLGKLSNKLVAQISDSTGYDLTGFSVMIRNYEVEHMLNEHGLGRETRENQRPVSEADIELLQDVFSSPDLIAKSSREDYAGRESLVFEKQMPDGRRVVITGIAVGSKVLAVDTMRILENTKKESLSTSNMGETIPDLTPEASKEPTLETKIAQHSPNVNSLTPPSTIIPEDSKIASTGRGVQRQFGSETAQKSNALHPETKEWLLNNSEYVSDTNRAQVVRAIGRIESEGFSSVLAAWMSADINTLNTADNQALGVTLMGIAAHTGDVQTEVQIADRYNQLGTVAGQALQARKVFNMLTPLGAAAYVQKQVDRINERLRLRGAVERVGVSDTTIQSVVNAENVAAREEAIDNAIKEIAKQVPPTWQDRFTAWRFLAMLGNSRTHVRNFLGNVMFMPVVGAKNKIGAGLEAIAMKAGFVDNRTKTGALRVEDRYREFARVDAKQNKAWLTGSGKYNEGDKVKEYRRSFGTSPLGKVAQWMVDKNGKALEAEDWVALSRHYRNALAGWLQANNVDLDSVDAATLDQARAYAFNEAQKATYRDASNFVSALNKLGRKENGELNAAGYILEGVLPFKKTPVNILKRGIEYSPVGLLTTIAKWGNQCVKADKARKVSETKGEDFNESDFMAMTGNDFIDGLASGLTGTLAMGLGMLLANAGWIKGSLGDDPEDDFWSLLGRQEYSVEVNGVSYTVDWVTPTSMPVLAGAAMAEYASENGWDLDTLSKGLMATAEPIFNLSMLDGVNSMIESASYSEENGVVGIATNALTGFLGQFIPTLLGQIARAADPVRRTVTTSKDGPLPKDVQYFIGKTMNKIPGLSTYSEPYINEWGEQEVNDHPEAARFAEQMLSPGYLSEVNPDETEKFLLDLSKTAGDSVFPTIPRNTFTVNKQEYTMPPKEYTEYKAYVGKTKKEIIDDLVKDETFLSMEPAYQAKAIEKAEDFANKMGRYRINSDYEVTPKYYLDAYEKGNAAQMVLDSTREAMADDAKAGGYRALDRAVTDSDYTVIDDTVAFLKESGVKDSGIKSHLSSEFKAAYQKAWLADDVEYCTKIENSLAAAKVGFKHTDFEKWQNDAVKE